MNQKKSFPNLTRNLPDAHLAEIGRVVVEWSFLEGIVDLAIAALLNLSPNKGLLITQNIRGFRSRLDILKSLVSESLREGETVDEVKRVIKLVEKAYAERNKIAHALWWGLDAPNYPALMFRKAGTPFDEMHPPQIRQIADDVRQASEKLSNFLAGKSFSWPPT
jgi:hypothetical protein